MRFRTKERPRGLLTANHQRRMTLMIAAFGLVLLGFSIVRKPQFWAGIFPQDDQPVAEPEATNTEESPVAAAPLDNGIAHDEFVTSDDVVSVTARKIAVAESEQPQAVDPKAIPTVPKELLRAVKDDVIGVHSTESDVYYASMKLASKLSDAHRRKAPKGAYALFMDSPAGSRGRAYRLNGKLRQLSVVKGRTNAYGIGSNLLYDAWITTADSGDKLVHVVASKADSSLGKRIKSNNQSRSIRFLDKSAPDVEFTGYFFKREGYASNQASGLSTAPLFVSDALHEVIEPEVVHTRADDINPYLGWLAVIVSCGVLMLVWGFTVSDHAHSGTRAHALTKLPATASFDEVTSKTVSEVLRDMSVEPGQPG